MAVDGIICQLADLSTSPRAARTETCPPAGARRQPVPELPRFGPLCRITASPVRVAASARVVGIPNACIASPNKYSRSTGPAPPCHRRHAKAGVRPDPFKWMSRRCPYGRSLRPEAALGHLPTAERNRRTGARQAMARARQLRVPRPGQHDRSRSRGQGACHQAQFGRWGPCSAARLPAQGPRAGPWHIEPSRSRA